MENESTDQQEIKLVNDRGQAKEDATVQKVIETTRKMHGSKLPRGLTTQPHSPSLEGRFGRMFRTLAPLRFPEQDNPENHPLHKLAKEMVADLIAPPIPEGQTNDEDNQGIDAGYTYLGQFIDHDITFDPASSLQKANDPQGLVDYRTPRFDLDSLYGRGPDDQPYLYEDDGIRMLLGRSMSPIGNDLPRNERKRALIGDPRNDENVIISQLQASMLQFHNKVVDFMHRRGGNPSFEDIQQAVRWHYQWVVLHDFLPTIVGDDPDKSPIGKILPRLLKEDAVNSLTEEEISEKAKFQFFKWKQEPYIPVEFSVAAYRFGHSMVRPIYRLNQTLDRLSIFGANPFNSLQGFREFPSSWAVDWNLFFSLGETSLSGSKQVQKSYKIATSLVNPLGTLPQSTVKNMPSLAERNLMRGNSMGLPSGQSVARHMGLTPLSDNELKVGKATVAASGTNKRLVDIDPAFKGKAPLWYYILAEAQHTFTNDDSQTIRLGPVGGTIIAEVIIGIVNGDQHSYLSQDPAWKPFPEFCRNSQFKMIDLLTIARSA